MSEQEKQYERGYRAAWCVVLKQAIRELLPLDTSAMTGAELKLGQVTGHLEDTRAMLRRVCAEFGDNDWGDELHLADVVEKHLARHLRNK